MAEECVDLRPWANNHRYRWRYEESHGAEKAENRQDGRWYVEVVCEHGLIYPKGGNTLLAHASAGIKQRIRLDIKGAEHHQWDGHAEVFRFPAERLDEVAAILRPRKRRRLDSDRARVIGKATFYIKRVSNENDSP
jgi:hypothetical protein